MRFAVVSDCHGQWSEVGEKLAELHCDGIFCLGDFVSDGNALAERTKLPIWSVRGNCDLGQCDQPWERIEEFQQHKILICHGHQYGVKSSLLRLYYVAQEVQCDIILFGHTHQWCSEWMGNVLFANPGSGSRPRDGAQSFGILTLESGHPAKWERILL